LQKSLALKGAHEVIPEREGDLYRITHREEYCTRNIIKLHVLFTNGCWSSRLGNSLEAIEDWIVFITIIIEKKEGKSEQLTSETYGARRRSLAEVLAMIKP